MGQLEGDKLETDFISGDLGAPAAGVNRYGHQGDSPEGEPR